MMFLNKYFLNHFRTLYLFNKKYFLHFNIRDKFKMNNENFVFTTYNFE